VLLTSSVGEADASALLQHVVVPSFFAEHTSAPLLAVRSQHASFGVS
jgi:hypothetical protein